MATLAAGLRAILEIHDVDRVQFESHVKQHLDEVRVAVHRVVRLRGSEGARLPQDYSASHLR